MSENKLPSIWEMAKSFSKELTKYVAEGAPNVSEPEYKKRLETCKGCEHFLADRNRCGACGCLVEHKAKWKTSNCPKNKWAPQIQSYGRIKKDTSSETSD